MLYSVKKQKSAGRLWLFCLLALIVGGALPGAMPRAAAQPLPPLPPVVYSNNIIYIGANYSSIDPAQAPYVEFPSDEQAPKSAITLPQVDEALTLQGFPDLIVNEGSVWTLKADTIISQTARLNVMLDSVSVLRLNSDSSGGQPLALTRVIAHGGHLNIQGDSPTSRIRVFSWDPASADPEGRDTVVDNGRSFLLALVGGRMDIINAEVSHLGWSPGEPSGLSWRKMAKKAGDPTNLAHIQTGATGSILNSDIHSNYFGQYSYEAYGLEVRNNAFHDNLYYGFDPHDFSTKFVVADNKVYNNGNHGIIFSRGCTLNVIINNEVYGNANHGIMLDRGSNNNEISGNLVYNNTDGVAIFQSSHNLIRGNTLQDNVRGIRVNATYDNDDIYDGVSTNNTISENIIQNNSQYGIYLYERADKNIITANEVMGSGSAGVYIKTGGNLIEGNTIEQNGHGVSIIGGEYITPPLGGPVYVTPESQPGLDNVIWANSIDNNTGMGIQIKGGKDNVIGALDPVANPEQRNLIRTNNTYGVGLTDGTTGTQLIGNTIHGSGRDGVLVKGAASVDNRISRNSIAANADDGIAISDGANNGILPPAISSAPDALTVTGSAPANSTVEIYRDANGQGAVYKGSTTVNGSGQWSFELPAGDNQQPGYISAIVIDQSGDTSAFATNAPASLKAVYTVGGGNKGELTVFVNGPGAIITLPDIQTALQTISPTVTLLENQGGGVWQLNASLFLNRGVTLRITGDTASWLKLRSQADDIVLAAAGDENYNYQSFAALRTYGGAILIDGVRITSWNPAANDYDRDISNGRSYLLAKYDARMDIKNAELSYLGSADGESYGIAWRDINDTDAPDVLRTRVTGDVVNSIFSYNYYGIYTYQASNMLFRNNKFHNNIGYGFDPHDFSTGFIVEDNEAFENGNHGFIISRGCNNFLFRNNKSYNNRYSVDGQDRNAHGFMLDPGSPNSRYPQEPSFNNVLENNQAWGNDGYGLRVVGSINNTIKGNRFTGNLQGITLEQTSTGNLVENNNINGSTLYGIYLIGGSDGNTLKGNTITESGKHGIYIKTGNNIIVGNTLRGNGSVTEVGPSGAGIAFLPDLPATAAADLMLPGMAGLASSDPELLSDPALASALTGNLIQSNIITKSADDGIELKGATNTTIANNTISYNGVHGSYLSDYEGLGATGNVITENTILGNGGHGIRANGAASLSNIWRANSVSGNAAGGITNTSSANNGIKPPKLDPVTGATVTGTTVPGARVEIFSDQMGQARFFEGATTAGADGKFSFTASQAWEGAIVNATATDGSGNSSGLAIDTGSRIVYLPIIRR